MRDTQIVSTTHFDCPDPQGGQRTDKSRKDCVSMIYFFGLALAVGLGVPIAVLSAAMAQGKVAASALESMARQPEQAGQLQTVMILAIAFIESLVIFSLLIFFLLSGKLPDLGVNDATKKPNTVTDIMRETK
jgi:F-type H+-transporting ATPase subunit c